MQKYKDMTYSIRKDNLLIRRVSINGTSISIYAHTPQELYDKYIKIKYQAKNSYYNTDTTYFKAYALKWLQINSSGKATGTVKEYEYIINKYLIPHFNNTKLSSISRIKLQELQSQLLNNNHYELANKCVRFTNSILNDALINGLIIRNPCSNMRTPKAPKKDKLPLTEEEDKILLESKHQYAPFFRIMRYTGMRKEEIIPLNKNDINWKTCIISINKAVDLTYNQPVIKSTKNKKTREVPILDIIKKDLIEICNNTDNLLFTKVTDNKMITNTSCRRMLERFCKDTGLKFTMHQLRHSYCTMLYYSGITIKECQRLMGHSSADMIYKIYAHLDEKKEDTFNKINSYIKNRV